MHDPKTHDSQTGTAVAAAESAVHVRRARPADVGTIASLIAGYARIGLVRRRTPAEVQRLVEAFLVAESPDGAVVGCASVRLHSPVLAEIASLAVDEGWHGNGVGRALIRTAVVRAHGQGVRRVFAFTSRVRLFERQGFRAAPVTDFPQKIAADYASSNLTVGQKSAVVLDLEARPLAAAPRAEAVTPSRRPIVSEASATSRPRIAILGAGNLGRALATGWTEAGFCRPADLVLTRREPERLAHFRDAGFRVEADNAAAARDADILLVAVQPQQVEGLLREIAPALDPERHRVISVVTGVSIEQIQAHLGPDVSVVRAMPNTAVAIRESMTCLAAADHGSPALAEARELFDLVGRTLVIPEDMMIPATALCACGIAFFLRCIRAASQGGIEIGFHPEDALLLAAQTAKGAASLILSQGRHPESEIDQVTTPRGCTIAGLNEMEHHGFSSAMIRGILLSAARAEGLATPVTPAGRAR